MWVEWVWVEWVWVGWVWVKGVGGLGGGKGFGFEGALSSTCSCWFRGQKGKQPFVGGGGRPN